MMAMLWVNQIMLGKKTYNQVPRLLKAQVKEILIDSGYEELVTEYIRQNNVENIKTDEMSGEQTVFYEYEEAKLTKAEYQEYLKELEIIDIQQQRADIDYIMLMTGIAED